MAMASPPASFDALPDEVLDQVFRYLDARALLSVTRVNKRVNALAGGTMLWHALAQSEFRHWSPEHQLPAKLAAPASRTDWRALVKARRTKESFFIATNFERALASPVGRMANLEAVADCGYDARDYLLRQLRVSPDADDYLARTFWAARVLGHIDRRDAIRELLSLYSDHDTPPERILACVDLCVLEPPPLSLDQMSDRFDRIAADFKSRHHQVLSSWTPRQLAEHIVSYLYEHNLVGARDEESYHDVQNSFITVALLEHDHPSLMLVSCAIFCALSRRLGLDASMVNFPQKVHALVSAPAGMTLDGLPSDLGPDDRPYSNTDYHVYVSLMTEKTFVSYNELREALRFYSHATGDVERVNFLCPTSTAHVVQRATLNLGHSREVRSLYHTRALEQTTMHCLSEDQLEEGIGPVEISHRPVPHAINLIRLILHRNFTYIDLLPRFLQMAEPDCFLDYSAVESMLLPLLPHNDSPHSPALTPHILASSRATEERVRAGIADARAANARFPLPTRRGLPGTQDARYRVGTYFYHRKYSYYGIIVGWDRRCEAPAMWVQQMRVNELPGGAAQVFYNIVDEQGNMRYVAEENVVAYGADAGGATVGRAGVHPGVVRCAGQWFKRWDGERECFVSNLEEEYPDD